MSIEYQIDDKKLIKVLNGLVLDGSQKSELFDILGENLVENAQLRFLDGVDAEGNSWPVSIRVATNGGQTMIDRGILRASLDHQVLADGVEYGTNIPYASALHFGVVIKPVTARFLAFKLPNGKFIRKKQVVLPPRPFVGISSEDELTVMDIIQKFMLKQVN